MAVVKATAKRAVLKSYLMTPSLHPLCMTARLRTAVSTRVWRGLESWRRQSIDPRRSWRNGRAEIPTDRDPTRKLQLDSLEAYGEHVLTADPVEEAQLTHDGYKAYLAGEIGLRGSGTAPDAPARPERPLRVAPKDMPSVDASGLPKAVFLLHNLAHIELNAIDLAWDTLVRFSGLKLESAFYQDFAHVADDESRHFCWCLERLRALGYDYGSMPVHDILWRSAEQSSSDVTARLALVPMAQEARGLDAGPRLVNRLNTLGDRSSANLVERIVEEEQAHVAVGLTHFLAILKRLNQSPDAVYRGWIAQLCPDLAAGRFDHSARRNVGLPRNWYDRSAWEGEISDRATLKALKQRLVEVVEQEAVRDVTS